MKKQTLLLLIICSVLLLTGCKANLNEVKKSTVLVNKDGTVKSVSMETFDMEYYDKGEAEQFIKEEVDAQNSQMGENSVTLEELKIDEKNKKAKLKMNFQNLNSYNEFNKTKLKSEKIEDIPSDALIVSAKTEEKVHLEDIKKDDKLKVVSSTDSQESIQVMVEGKILYYSYGAKLVEKDVVETKINETCYIIYK